MDSLLLDTGPVVAILRREDMDHGRCVAALEREERRLLTTEAVVTEACHLVSGAPGGIPACLDFFLRMEVQLIPPTPALLLQCRHLTERDADTPLDFADAMLVATAEAAGLRDIFTLDRRGFSVYRIGKHRNFRILQL